MVIAPIATPAPVEPGINVSVTATLTTGSGPVWSWRRVSGPAIQLAASGTTATSSSVTFVSPSVMPPTSGTLVIGVTASQGGFTTPERTVTITVLPQIRWVLHDGVWVGRQLVAFVSQPQSDAFTDIFTDDF